MPSIRIMIVDDHEVVRTGLKAILEPEEGLEVVGEASSGNEAVEKAPLLGPDLVLMDVRMEEMGGIEACRLIKSAHPQVKVLMLTSFGDEEAVMASIMGGASAYLLKNVGRTELIRAIRGVAAGQNLLDPAVTKRVMERLAQLASREEEREVEGLSGREKEVLALVARGSTNKEIGEMLVISEHTARNHVSHILEKLGLTRRSEAAVFAAEHGLLGSKDRGDPPD